jgi:DNA ligase D-like protein (predicted polymerase)/DNA ligase D-like protein (predicted 3'-phosphoesterase)
MGLETYHKKRDFRRTPEPKGKLSKSNRHRFVVQEHHASKLHFDFRLEMGGVLKSWSVPKGPSLDPSDKRFAVPTEDHPVEYLKFQGHIPEGNYGAGEHMIWDAGRYELVSGTDALEQLAKGRLNFRLRGRKLQGEFNLIRMGQRENQWLLIKSRDEYAEPGWTIELLMKEEGGGPSGTKKRDERGAKKGVRKISLEPKGTERAVAASRFFKTEGEGADAIVKVKDAVVSLTHLDKVYWPEDGYTKGDLIRYYYSVAKYILPYLKDRALIMKRYPNGINEPSFHQHDVNEAPEFVRTARLSVEEGHEVDYIVGDNLPTLLYMANLGAIERHPWHSRIRNLDRPDWLVFDLDPGEGISFQTICELALGVREVLERLGLEGYAKTSGSRGMHVYVPVKPRYGYEQVAELAERVATVVASEHASIATVERSLKRRRRGQIYVDHMQNARGKSVVAPYSVRPRSGATVSAPLDWREVEDARLTVQDFHIKNMGQRIARKGDLFEPVLKEKQTLDEAMEKAQSLPGKPGRARRAAS